ncbi:MAG: hypothetical protein N3B68_03815 [Anaerolineae bacterium]|nr:hypothetical protein [Anaerolineae bacterium]
MSDQTVCVQKDDPSLQGLQRGFQFREVPMGLNQAEVCLQLVFHGPRGCHHDSQRVRVAVLIPGDNSNDTCNPPTGVMNRGRCPGQTVQTLEKMLRPNNLNGHPLIQR